MYALFPQQIDKNTSFYSLATSNVSITVFRNEPLFIHIATFRPINPLSPPAIRYRPFAWRRADRQNL